MAKSLNDRCQQILFSDPDYCIPQAFAVEAGKKIPLELTFEALAPTAYSHLPVCFQYVGGASGAAFDPIYIAIQNTTTTALIA